MGMGFMNAPYNNLYTIGNVSRNSPTSQHESALMQGSSSVATVVVALELPEAVTGTSFAFLSD